MERILNIDMVIECKKISTAGNKFINSLKKKYSQEEINGYDEEIIELINNMDSDKIVIKEIGQFIIEIDTTIIEGSIYINLITWKHDRVA